MGYSKETNKGIRREILRALGKPELDEDMQVTITEGQLQDIDAAEKRGASNEELNQIIRSDGSTTIIVDRTPSSHRKMNDWMRQGVRRGQLIEKQ